MKKTALMVLVLALTACTEEKKQELACQVEAKATAAISATIVKELACADAAAVEADIKVAMEKTNLCKKQEEQPVAQSALGDLLCPLASDAAVVYLQAQIPASWKCTGGDKKDQLKQLLTDECKKQLQ